MGTKASNLFVVKNNVTPHKLFIAEMLNQGIIDCKRTETFAKEPTLAKLLRELKPTLVSYNKKSPLVFAACL